MECPPTSSLFLPWELIERIIGHSCDDPNAIRNFSLTCRELNPRSICLLVAEPRLYSRDKIFDFSDFLQAKPHLQPLVRSITVGPDDFAPFPLLRILPNLSKIEFADAYATPPDMVLNRSTLTICQLLGTRIQSLSFCNINFTTSIRFLQVLSAFPSLVHLSCLDVFFEGEGGRAATDVAKRRLSRRLRLRTVSHPAYFSCSTKAQICIFYSSILATAEGLTWTRSMTVESATRLHLLASSSWTPGWFKPRWRTSL